MGFGVVDLWFETMNYQNFLYKFLVIGNCLGFNFNI